MSCRERLKGLITVFARGSRETQPWFDILCWEVSTGLGAAAENLQVWLQNKTTHKKKKKKD